jgi:hypothetical protein
MAFLGAKTPKITELAIREYSGSGVTETTWLNIIRKEIYPCDDNNQAGETLDATVDSTIESIGTELRYQRTDPGAGYGQPNGTCTVIYEGKTPPVLVSSL